MPFFDAVFEEENVVTHLHDGIHVVCINYGADVVLLCDVLNEFVNNQIEIRSLDSLHAKIYIIDDWCLVTSANLTGTAFLCRYEMGIASNKILEVEKTFQRWWNMATPVKALLNKPPKALLEYQDGHTFKKKFKAQPYKSGKQDKYDAICEKYMDFAKPAPNSGNYFSAYIFAHLPLS